MTTPTPTRLYRYSEAHGTFMCRRYGDPLVPKATDEFLAGGFHARPEWLTRIIDTARVGGMVPNVPLPPPDSILWFYTDDDHNLTSFRDFGT